MLLPLIGLTPQRLEDWAVARRTSERRHLPLFMAFREDFPDLWKAWIAPFHADAGLLTPYGSHARGACRGRLRERYPAEAAFLSRFLEIIHMAEGQGCTSLSSFLEHWNRHGQQEKAPMPEALDAVRVMTMTSSKGLQFPVVIVPWNHLLPPRGQPRRGSTRQRPHHPHGTLPGLRPRALQGHRGYGPRLDLLYVAWTRAERM
ncbi:MAG: hypothetical protein V8Q84_10635 [Bilophila sp.]